MAKKKASKRPKEYEPKLAVKKGVEWDDLINLSLQPEKKPAKKAPKKSKRK